MQRTKLHRFTSSRQIVWEERSENASGAPFKSAFWHFQVASANF
jgi:hypothetical protein